MIYTFSFCHVSRSLSTIEFLNILLWCVRARFFYHFAKFIITFSGFIQEQNNLYIHQTDILDQVLSALSRQNVFIKVLYQGFQDFANQT